jgi:multidrug resistance efflux pump
MAVAFSQSMRVLAVDRGRWSLTGLVMVLVLLGGWGAWCAYARITVYAITQTAQLEIDQAGHPIATPVAGRIVTTSLVVGRAVQVGEVLVELDAEAPRLQQEEARARLTALMAQRQARRQELTAEEVAQQNERRAARVALDEARARYREAEVAARAATEQADIFVRLDARGLASRLELLRTKADADQKRAAADALRLAISRMESDQRTKDSDRTARLTQFHREVTRLDGDIRTAEATLALLAHTIDQTRIRAPITGHLGEVATLQPGTVVRQGDTLGVVLPAGALQVVASFLPAIALGRVQPGQSARLRGWRLRDVEPPVYQGGLEQGEMEALGVWLEAAALWLGLEAEPVEVSYAEVESLVRGSGPALLRLPGLEKPGFLALLGSQGCRVMLVGPDLAVHPMAVEVICTALCHVAEAPLMAEVEQILAAVGVPRQRRPRALRAMLNERLSAERLGDCWVLHLPADASFWQQVRQAHLPRRLLGLLGASLNLSQFVEDQNGLNTSQILLPWPYWQW